MQENTIKQEKKIEKMYYRIISINDIFKDLKERTEIFRNMMYNLSKSGIKLDDKDVVIDILNSSIILNESRLKQIRSELIKKLFDTIKNSPVGEKITKENEDKFTEDLLNTYSKSLTIYKYNQSKLERMVEKCYKEMERLSSQRIKMCSKIVNHADKESVVEVQEETIDLLIEQIEKLEEYLFKFMGEADKKHVNCEELISIYRGKWNKYYEIFLEMKERDEVMKKYK